MNKIKLFAAALGLLLFSSAVFSQSDKAKKIDDFIAPFVKADQFSGVILASENGRVIYEKAFGLANADFKIPNKPDTRIGIASVTKPMTGVIVNRLLESGKIANSDKLSKYIPDFPNGDKITIEMLRTHRSGIQHRVMPSEAESVYYTSAEFIEKVKQSKLAFEPGTQRLYSSGGYAVLARVLEIATGKSYAELLREYVFAPAGMTDSVNCDGETIIERRAQDYFLSPNGYVNAPLKDYSFLVGAGSVFSTARDVYRFGEAVIDGKYGERTKTALVQENTLSLSGSTNGHRAYIEIEGGKKYGYVMLANLSGAFDVISQGLKEILEGKEVTVKSFSIPKIIDNPNKDLKEFTGHYKRADGAETDIVLKNDSLSTAEIKLYPIKPDCFFEYRYFGEACFIRDAAGRVKELKWKGFGFDFLWTKI
jgi:CubicO group peptidase (beta-lactamase class C family)